MDVQLLTVQITSDMDVQLVTVQIGKHYLNSFGFIMLQSPVHQQGK
jgi:hypothetical protein